MPSGSHAGENGKTSVASMRGAAVRPLLLLWLCAAVCGSPDPVRTWVTREEITVLMGSDAHIQVRRDRLS